MSNKKPDFTKPDIAFRKSPKFKVRTSQVPPLDVAFDHMALTDYQLLVATIRKLNELIMMTNSYTEFIDEILKWVVGDGIDMTVRNILELWLNDGTLETIINETLFNSKLDKEDFNDFISEVYDVFVKDINEELDKKVDKITYNEDKTNFMVLYNEHIAEQDETNKTHEKNK